MDNFNKISKTTNLKPFDVKILHTTYFLLDAINI